MAKPTKKIRDLPAKKKSDKVRGGILSSRRALKVTQAATRTSTKP